MKDKIMVFLITGFIKILYSLPPFLGDITYKTAYDPEKDRFTIMIDPKGLFVTILVTLTIIVILAEITMLVVWLF